MANRTLIYNARLYKAYSLFIFPIKAGEKGYVYIEDGFIRNVSKGKKPEDLPSDCELIDAEGAILMPGLIDTHVHFREPGLTHKGTIRSESLAAVAGGITSYLEMPNTIPATTTAEAFQQKLDIAAATSAANYGFMLGASDGSMRALESINPSQLPAVKLFMGTTTGGMAMPGREELHDILHYCSENDIPVVVHAEDNNIIADNTSAAIAKYGSREDVPLCEHRRIRSAEACLSCTRAALSLAEKEHIRLHIAHVSTREEAELLRGHHSNDKITAETTPMYLDATFSDPRNRTWRHKINPAVKEDADALREALLKDVIDTIATDHAPHLRNEKQGGALTAASGAPSVQFALPVMLEYLSPETIAEKMAREPARIFGIENRGVIRPGYHADLVLVKECAPHIISDEDVISPCGWTPFAGHTVSHRVSDVWVNGVRTVSDGELTHETGAEALVFRHRKPE